MLVTGHVSMPTTALSISGWRVGGREREMTEERFKNESLSLISSPFSRPNPTHTHTSTSPPTPGLPSHLLPLPLFILESFILNVTYMLWLFLSLSLPPLSTTSNPPTPPKLRPLQPGSISRWHLWPEAARSAATWSHPDPEAAGGGGRLRGLQHRAQRSELLPARMFTYRSM